ncbi:MAG: ribonucleoside triphosphate reductase [Parvularculaceae bacterium]
MKQEAVVGAASVLSDTEQAIAPPTCVVKRSGASAPYDRTRIETAIAKAGAASGEIERGAAAAIAKLVELNLRMTGDETPAIERIQDCVEETLIEGGFVETARRYIAYRAKRANARAERRTLVDVQSSIEEYVNRADWRVQANANQGYSLGGLILNSSGKLSANYWLDQVYPEEVAAAHREGALHIHDLDLLAGYCAGWSLRTILEEGLNGVPGKIEAAPPRHFSSALGQIVNFLGTLQNEWAGAQALSSFDTYLAPFVRLDGLDYPQVRQMMQEFIFNLNAPSRWGTQTPFTNLTFDWTCPDDLRDTAPMIGGAHCAFVYGDLADEMALINRAFIEVMMEGDARGRVFTFPIPTYNITSDFRWDDENAERLFEMTAKYGLPYFQNFINSEMEPGQVRSMCCRLQLDLRELLMRGNGLFGSAEQTGSIGVVTINCARLGYLHRGDGDALYAAFDELLDLAKTSLELKRKQVQRFLDQGLYPFTKRYLGTFRNHFSTVGVNGVNEMIRNFTEDREMIATEYGHAFASRLLEHARARIREMQEETGHLYNLEASPAEGATYRFAREDLKRFSDIIQAGTPDAPYYTNSSQLPVGLTDDPFEALRLQDDLQCRYTGGTVLHLYMGEKLSSAEACKTLVRRTLSKFRLPYITVTPTFSICPTHGYLAGEHQFCPHCDKSPQVDGEAKKRQICEVWTRVMGYHRPVAAFNAGKRSEHEERLHFREPVPAGAGR